MEQKVLSDAEVGFGTEQKPLSDTDVGFTNEKTGVLNNAVAGANETFASLAGLPVDLAAKVLKIPEHLRDRIVAKRPEFASDIERYNKMMDNAIGGSMSIKKLFEMLGSNPDNVKANTVPERLARGAGAGAVSAVAPAAAAERLLATTWLEGDTLARAALTAVKGTGQVSNAVVGAAAGAGGEAAAEVAPEEYKPVARVVGGLAAALPAAGVVALAEAGTNAAKHTWRNTFESAEVRAARIMLDRAANPKAFRQGLKDLPDEIVPGSEPTTGQATGDVGILALERGVERSPGNVAAFAERRAQQNTARLQELKKISDPTANSEAVTDYVRGRLRELEVTHAARVAQAADDVAEALARTGGTEADNAAAYGEAIRNTLKPLHDEAKVEANRLWRAIDPDLKSPVQVSPLKSSTSKLLDEIAQTAKPPSGEEGAIYKVIEDLAETATFGDLVALRSRTTDAIREERRAGTPTALRRLSITLGNIDDTLSGAAGDLVADAARKPTMLERLQVELNQWMSGAKVHEGELTGTTGAGAGAGVGEAAARGQTAIRGAPGTEGPGGSGLGPSTRGEGVSKSPDLATKWAAEGKARGLASKYEPVASGDEPIIYHGLKPGYERGGYLFVTRDSEGAAFHGDVQAFKLKPGATIYPDLEGSTKNTGIDTLLNTKASSSSGIVHMDDLVPVGTKGVDESVASRYAAARAATKELKQTFESGPVGAVLRPGAQAGSFAMTPSNVPKNLFDRPEALRALADATGGKLAEDSPLHHVQEYAAWSLRQSAVRDGQLNPAKYEKWVLDHQAQLRMFPELKEKLANLRAAQEVLDQNLAAQKQTLTEFQKGAARRFLNQDPEQAAASALKNPAEFAQVADLVRKDAAAQAGLKRAVVEHMLGKVLSTAEAGTSGTPQIKSDTLQRFIRDNKEALGKLFTSQEMKSMETVAADLQRANRSIVAARVPGGSNTAQDAAAVGQRNMSYLEAIMHHAMDKAVGTGVGTLMGHPLIGFIMGSGISGLRVTKMDTLENALAEMMLNPRIAAAAVARIPEKEAERAMEKFLARVRAATANQFIQESMRKKDY